MTLGYLVSQYLAVNHTYLQREIRCLRELGFQIVTVSIRPADRPTAQLTPEEREELPRVRAVTAAGPAYLLKAHLATLFTNPAGYLRGLFAAFGLDFPNPRLTLFNLLYFAEAVVAGRWFLSSGVRHFHVHYSSTVGLFVTRIFPLTMSITFHGRGEFVDPTGFHIAEKVTASRFVTAISHYAKSRIMMALDDPNDWAKIDLSRLGVDVPAFPTTPFREAPEVFEIISVGQLVPIKAQHILLAAFAGVIRDGIPARLHLVGDGPLRASLERQAATLGIRDHVVFSGKLSYDKVQELYQTSDLFVLSSFDEGVPVVLMEAMTMQIPCIATGVAGIPELIRPGVEGLLVPPSDEEALAGAIRQLVADPTLRRQFAQSGRARVEELFNLRPNTKGLAGIFRRRLSHVANISRD